MMQIVMAEILHMVKVLAVFIMTVMLCASTGRNAFCRLPFRLFAELGAGVSCAPVIISDCE